MRSRKAISSDEDPGSRRRKGQAQVLRRGLQEDNHAVSLAHDGPSALSLAQDTQFDLVLLDVMLPGINGIQVARRFRELRQDITIFMLTARDSVPDIVKGLDSGADDHVTKPFSFAVLLARIRAPERRVAEPRTHTLRSGAGDHRAARLPWDSRSPSH